MKFSKPKISIALTLLLTPLLIAGCRYNKYLPSFLRSFLESDPEPEDMFELEEIPIEVVIPKEIEEADYFFTLEIDRDGTVLDEAINYSQSDSVEVVVYGKDDRLFGKEEYGDQIVFVLPKDGCTMHCAGDIGYVVTGDLDTHCIMTLRITQIPQMTSCTSECAPGVPLTWSTGLGEVIIDPLLINFKDLAKGESRIEKLGNMKWEAKYKLKDFNGLPFIKYCDKQDLP
jgi:hypothetical protein